MKKIKVFTLKDGFVDKNGHIMPTNAIIGFKQTIPLTKKFSTKVEDILGEASIEREGNDFYIKNIKIFEQDMERAILEANLYPAIGGMIKKREGNNIVDFTIDQVSFSVSPNVDPDIKSVKTQVQEQDN